jgi:hypothetical protein
MTDPDLWHFFMDELHETEKVAVTVGGIASGAAEAAKNFGTHFAGGAADPLKALHPTGKYLKKGWDALSNAGPKAREAMQGAIARGARSGHDYRADFHNGKGVLNKLRSGGWLSNTPKYMGDLKSSKGTELVRHGVKGGYSKVEKAKNMALRALPGGKALHVAPALHGAYSELKQKEDPQTGRKIGLGERAGGAAMSLGTGLVGAGSSEAKTWAGTAGSMVGGATGASLGGYVGRKGGRTLDEAVSRLRRKPSKGKGRS